MKTLPTLRQLRYLVAVADQCHFGRAARACFVTQSTLSASLKELETLLGALLILLALVWGAYLLYRQYENRETYD